MAVLASLSLSLVEAALLGSLFLAQLVLGGFLHAALHSPEAAAAEMVWFTVAYMVLGALFLFQARSTIGELFSQRRRNRTQPGYSDA